MSVWISYTSTTKKSEYPKRMVTYLNNIPLRKETTRASENF